MQRFTAAHELGHFTLQHEGSLDREIRFPGQVANRDLNEIAADAFAAEFLMPKWLFKHQARLHGWTTEKLKEPVNVYQLSLRMAVSYQATCLGLLGHDILDSATVAALQAVTPKKTKQAILGSLELDNWHPHVWLLDEHDDGGTIQAGPDDVFIAALTEHGSSGYLWDTDAIAEVGFKIIGDDADAQAAKGVGGPYTRRLVLKAPGPGIHQLPLSERRPWQKAGAPLHSLTLGISTFGAENEGLPRRSRLAYEEQQVVH
jgi:predicted secreted protein